VRERNELWIDHFSPSHSEGGPGKEFAESGVASGTAAAVPGRLANVGPSSRSGTRIVVRLLALLIMAIAMLAAPASSSAQIAVGISVSFGPPALPLYSQPFCPGSGYIWMPGYWAWDPDFGYFWVPGTWVMAPFAGALWTPGYWAFADGFYVWNEGYWGPVVGYYGGIFYGFGYTGYGYEGGYWNRGRFYYNRSVNNVQTTNITNVYNKTVVNNVNVSTVSYNGGPGGTNARPTAEQLTAVNQRRSGPVAEQTQHIQTAHSDPRLRASENKGRPAVAATPRPGQFSGREVIQASRAGAPYQPPEPKAANPNRSAPRSMPAGNASPAGRQSPEAPAPGRAEPPVAWSIKHLQRSVRPLSRLSLPSRSTSVSDLLPSSLARTQLACLRSASPRLAPKRGGQISRLNRPRSKAVGKNTNRINRTSSR
jgi:hypothetical protein